VDFAYNSQVIDSLGVGESSFRLGFCIAYIPGLGLVLLLILMKIVLVLVFVS